MERLSGARKKVLDMVRSVRFILGSVGNQFMVSTENGVIILCDPLNTATGSVGEASE